MRTILSAFSLAYLVAAAAAAASPDLSGTWRVQFGSASSDGWASDVCTFKQKGSALSGYCGPDAAQNIVNGKIEDGNVTWEFRLGQALEIKATFIAHLGPNTAEMRGTWSSFNESDGTTFSGMFQANKNSR
jgi:hypothetical protein